MVLALPDDGRRYELVSGQLVVTPAPRRLHQRTIAALFLRLHAWVQASGIGEVLFSPADLSFGEEEILQPDLFVTLEPDHGPGQEWSDIRALALVVEVLSPGTASYDRELKRRRYQRAGIPEYWVVDPDARRIERWRPGDEEPEVIGGRLVWQPIPGGPVMELEVEEMFSAPRPAP